MTFEALGSQPLCFNPAARTAGYTPLVPPAPAAPPPSYARTRDDALRARQQACAASLAASGLVLVRDVLPYVTVHLRTGAVLHAELDGDAVRRDHPRCRAAVPLLLAAIKGWPQHWLRAARQGRSPLTPGEWACVRHADGTTIIGKVLLGQQAVGSACTLREWHCDRTNRLLETSHDAAFAPAMGVSVARAVCWLDTPEPPPEQAQWVNSRLPRKHVPPPTWRWAGLDGDARLDPTAWLACGRPICGASRADGCWPGSATEISTLPCSHSCLMNATGRSPPSPARSDVNGVGRPSHDQPVHGVIYSCSRLTMTMSQRRHDSLWARSSRPAGPRRSPYARDRPCGSYTCVACRLALARAAMDFVQLLRRWLIRLPSRFLRHTSTSLSTPPLRGGCGSRC